LLDDAKGYFIAASCYAKALELDPSNTDVRVDYAICKLNMNDAKGGLEEMKRAVEQNPKHQKANLNIGILYAQSEEWSLVKKHWTIAYNLDKASDAGKRADELLAKYTEKFKK
jgi:tetratricopeptide (TPR) repeat protein